jgi:hypothetical protein
MIVVAILLTWIVIGASYYWLGNARLVVSNLSTVQAPNLAQTSAIASYRKVVHHQVILKLYLRRLFQNSSRS